MMEAQTVSFNVEYLKESAKNIALSHTNVVRGKGVRPIKPILADAKSTLTDAYRVLSGYAKAEGELSPAAEWLIDNFYIIQEQIVQTDNDFPIQYQKTVPLILKGELKGFPRVYELILNYLALTDNLADYDSLIQYVQSYQQVVTLEQGEIWAIPIMIRLILIQKLAEKATRILHRKKMKKSIEKLVSELDPRESREPGVTVNMLSSRFNSNEEVKRDAFYLVELYNQLQSSGNLFDEEKRWFNYRFQQVDMRLEEAMRFEAQIESRLQVSVQNAVISLRNSSEIDWSDFVEECSVIEKILRLDPAGRYHKMDFQTRDSYRRAVERLSRRSDLSETDVAEQVLMMVEEYTQNLQVSAGSRLNNDDVVKFHVGYFLVGDGFDDLSKRVKYAMPLKEKVHRRLEKSTSLYVWAVILHTIALMVILWVATGSMTLSTAHGLAVLLVALFPALDLSISAVNRFFAFFLPPRILPKMEFEEGIPDNARTMVVVPTMFSSPQDVRRQVENLEIRSLANPDSALQFVLLSDFRDADQKEEEADSKIIDAAKEAINELNYKYTSRYGDKFFFLHRERQWNASEEKWIGWERKRGKLEEFNRLLFNTDSETGYKFIGGKFFDSLKKGDIQFIITLDSDTKLPPDSARHLVRTIAHPLNRPWYNEDLKRVTKGYGIIQPRISIPAEFSRKTWFTRIFSGNVGLDPYSTAVSDIYQDLAGEAIFTGKGIYDLEAFHKVLDERFPENRILSHDLIESTYLRAGLATDIELFDDYPSTYTAFSNRSHRWIRGDWQIASWLFSTVPTRDGKEKNSINLLSKWKIFDNLRRSLNPFFLILFFIAGWFLLPGSALIWTAAAFGILAFPIYVSLSSDILNRPARVRWKLYLEKIHDNLKINSVQTIFTLIILPHQAMVQLDAVIRTVYRLLISRKYLLEWTTASQIETTSANSLKTYIRQNIISVFLAAGILAVTLSSAPHYLWIVVPFVILWGGAPFYLWYVSQPTRVKDQPLSNEDISRLRIYARKTWFYFERLVNEEQNWLPPDNYQEDPPIPVAGRTSPTNIGLALVSTQVACNMGYITFGERLERMLHTLHTLDKLEKFNGHFYNWYNTKLGEVLSPKYISTVDSGNLAASLIVVKQAVLQAMENPHINKQIWSGLTETLMAVKDIFETFEGDECLSGD
jgi:cellulose synthase/poly-beta-1,6-N-acetylglucosamine synthase-like glycosyltransferase